MSRPQANAVLGFYPFPPACLPLLAKHLEPPEDPESCFVLDPCAGKGVAVSELARHLHVPPENVYAVELSQSRTTDLRREYPQMRILGPAPFAGTGISYNAFSLIYLNPPYSDEMGGGRREELTFLVRAINHAAAGAVLVFVVPETTLFDYGHATASMRATLSCRLDDVAVFALPDAHRHHKEVVVFGVKRRQAVPDGGGVLGKDDRWWEARDRMGTLGDAPRTYRPPPGKAPKRWEQTADTPEALRKKVLASPLARHLEPPRPSRAASPPLPPGRGHTALYLVSGNLDGLVWPPGEPPHVVRGQSVKVKYRDAAKCEFNLNEDGTTSQKEVISEKPVTTVRAVSTDGTIHTFTDNTMPEDLKDVPDAPDEDA